MGAVGVRHVVAKARVERRGDDHDGGVAAARAEADGLDEGRALHRLVRDDQEVVAHEVIQPAAPQVGLRVHSEITESSPPSATSPASSVLKPPSPKTTVIWPFPSWPTVPPPHPPSATRAPTASPPAPSSSASLSPASQLSQFPHG